VVPGVLRSLGATNLGLNESVGALLFARGFLKDAQNQNVVKSVHVQVCSKREDALAETRWLQSIADDPRSRGFPHAIVAWADLSDSKVEDVLKAQRAFSNVRGIRQIASRNSDPVLNQARIDYLNDAGWLRNFSRLADYGLSFDLQISTPQLWDAARLAGRTQMSR